MTGSIPYSECDETAALLDIQAGKTPQRPSEGIPESIWQLLEKCWSMGPRERPSVTQIYNTLSKFRSIRPVIEELPERFTLQFQSIKISFTRAKKRQFYVKFKYGKMDHITSLTTRATASSEYTWFALCPSTCLPLPLSLGQELSGNLVDRNKGTSSQTGGLLPGSLPDNYGRIQERQERRSLCDREILRKSVTAAQVRTSSIIHVQLLGSANKQIQVELKAPDITGEAVLKILVT